MPEEGKQPPPPPDGGGGGGLVVVVVVVVVVVEEHQYNSEKCCHNQHNKDLDSQLLPTIHQIEHATLGHLTWSNSAFDQAEEIHKQTIYLYKCN